MSSIFIRDLSHSKELDRHAMSGVRGGQGDNIRIGSPNIDIGVNVIQAVNLKQFTNVQVAGYGSKLPNFGMSPAQIVSLNASPTISV